MFAALSGWEIGAIVLVALLLFGAKKLPELARSVGKSVKELRTGLKEGLADEEDQES